MRSAGALAMVLWRGVNALRKRSMLWAKWLGSGEGEGGVDSADGLVLRRRVSTLGKCGTL